MDLDADAAHRSQLTTAATHATDNSQSIAASPPVHPTPGLQRHFRSIYAEDGGDGEGTLLCPDTDDEDDAMEGQ